MQQVISAPIIPDVRLRRPAIAADAAVAPSSVARRGVSRVEVWRDTIAMFGTHCGPILVSALIGFAGVSAVAQSFGLLSGERSGSDPQPLLLWAALGLPLRML